MSSPELTASIGASSMKRSASSPRTLFASAMTAIAFVCAGLALLPLVLVSAYVLVNGLSRLNLQVFTTLPPAPLNIPAKAPIPLEFYAGGFGNALLGTLITVGIAALIAIPFGVLAAVFLAEFARDSKVAEVINFATNVLSGVPSIVIGVFAFGLIVLPTKTPSAFAAGVALAVLMLPTIVRTATEALESVPNDYRQAAIGLGATRIQTTLGVVLPSAIPTIVTGAMLAVARAAGETAPVLFTARFSSFWNTNIFKDPIATMSMLVFNFATVPYKNQNSLAWAGALVLVALVLITSILARWVTRRR